MLISHDRKVNSRNAAFKLQRNLQGMCGCIYLIGQHSDLSVYIVLSNMITEFLIPCMIVPEKRNHNTVTCY